MRSATDHAGSTLRRSIAAALASLTILLLLASCSPTPETAVGLRAEGKEVHVLVTTCPGESIERVVVGLRPTFSHDPPSLWEIETVDITGTQEIVVGETPPGWITDVPFEGIPPGRSLDVWVDTTDTTYAVMVDPDRLVDDRLAVGGERFMTRDRFDQNREDECRSTHAGIPFLRWPLAFVLVLPIAVVGAMALAVEIWMRRRGRRAPTIPGRPDLSGR